MAPRSMLSKPPPIAPATSSKPLQNLPPDMAQRVIKTLGNDPNDDFNSLGALLTLTVVGEWGWEEERCFENFMKRLGRDSSMLIDRLREVRIDQRWVFSDSFPSSFRTLREGEDSSQVLPP